MSKSAWARRVGLGTAAVVGTWAAVGMTPASADPAKGLPISIECDNGTTYTAVSNGNGNWTPAHDLNSTAVLIPTSFGEQTITITDADGNVIDSETDPGVTKASTKPRATTINCDFSGSATFVDPELGPLTFTVTGTVTGFVTPARK